MDVAVISTSWSVQIIILTPHLPSMISVDSTNILVLKAKVDQIRNSPLPAFLAAYRLPNPWFGPITAPSAAPSTTYCWYLSSQFITFFSRSTRASISITLDKYLKNKIKINTNHLGTKSALQ